jgi:hypothetical protein
MNIRGKCQQDQSAIRKEKDGMKTSVTFQIGQSVRVNEGVKEEDGGLDMAGWHGRIRELDPHNKLMLIAFDSVTLRGLPLEYVEQCEEEGMDWTTYYIGYNEVAPASARDTEAEAQAAADEIAAQAGWAYLGEDGRAINAILDDVDIEDEMGQMEAWYDHFEQSLTFPFTAVVDEPQEYGSPVGAGDQVKVLALTDADDLYGVLVKVKRQNKTFIFPLCDLKAVAKTSANYRPVYLYAVWFANC